MSTPVFDGVMYDQNNQYKDDDKLFVQFFKEAIQNNYKSEQEARPVFDEVDMIRIFTPGSRDTVVAKATAQYQARFPRQWGAYKANQDQAVSGTPLEQVPFLSVGQIAELKAVNVRTLEQLAAMADVEAQKFMGNFALRERAKNFLLAAKEAAPLLKLQGELEKRDDVIETLKRQNAELAARLDQFIASQSAPAKAK